MFCTFNAVLLIVISAIISNTYVISINNKYNNFYKNSKDTIKGKAIITKDYIEKDYSYIYEIKMVNDINKKFLLNVKKEEKNIFEYGDLIELEATYILPSESRNYKGFNYRNYLKIKGIYGTLKVKDNKIKVIGKNKTNIIYMTANKIRNSIKSKAESLLPDETNKLLIGILLGDKSKISEEIIKDFKTSNLSHILSVSGAHTSYIILAVTCILTKSRVSKRYTNIGTIIILIIFMIITNFTPSVIRACLMGIIVLGSKIFYRKSDVITSISLSLLIILIFNPLSICEIGLQLSYLGTLGIILLHKNIEILFYKIKINEKLTKILSITFSAQVMIMPVTALNFNKMSLTFFISNILVSPLLGIVMILGFITIFISYLSFELAKMLAILLDLSLKLIIIISEFSAKLPFSSITIVTLYIISIILIYFFIFLANYIYSIFISKENPRRFEKEIIKLINYKNIKIGILIFLIVILIANISIYLYRQIFPELKIYFVDVGQGDCTFIITPSRKTILIDGGEKEPQVLLPYLLDRRIKNIDYILISHFDSDHCNGLIEVIEELKVKNIIISKQAYISEEYINIANLINKKRINAIIAKQGDTLKIDKDLKIEILYPKREFRI